MQQPPRILFLYAHIQPFLVAGVRKLVENYKVQVLVVSWPTPQASPVKLIEHDNISLLVKDNNATAIQDQVFKFAPDAVYSVGWMDKDYLRWTKRLKRSGAKTIMAMDTQWTGSLKQRINCLMAPFFLRSIFSHAWVPGYFQYEYASRLGFPREKILSRLLTADNNLFKAAFQNSINKKKRVFPKSFLYVGRLIPMKFESLLGAFSTLSEDDLKGWKLVVVGDGPMKELPEIKSKNIILKGFMQQSDVAREMENAGVFCLTSYTEAWGTVIQEAAVGGLPLLLSKQCGAHYSSLINGFNGFLCDGHDLSDIKKVIKKFIELSDNELVEMSERSSQLNSSADSETWAATFMSIFQ
ncbi:MAG TPA: glycosyltransferase [Flavipsychrobacter sp.]|nr:glycosyltransferase [Flavipsychrobacter sp.]